ncbi:hypothetical protein [Adhaeribacter aquaticus]|uniref:hypothetical protein n=1 Tax=Adhaeribacter aquaticus TaxID=299567 RepID=UPI0003FAE11C|nr:hypothetical protein [Adhaeribacter aquaticus]
MKHFFLILFFVAGVVGMAEAQNYKLSKEPQQFITDLKSMMASTHNQGAMEVGAKFEGLWNNKQLTPTQQTRIIDLSQKMLGRKLRARPHFENFLGAIVSGVTVQNLNNVALDQFLTVTEKTLTHEQIPAFDKYLQTAYTFLDSKVIYKSQLNALRVLGGTFSFAYLDGSESKSLDEKNEKTKIKKEAKKKPVKDGEITWFTDVADSTTADALVSGSASSIPAVKGAVLQLQNIDLFLSNREDSLLLKNTSGAVLLSKNTYVGDKGHFEWLQKNGEASADFKKFSFDVTKPVFKAENVTLTYPAVLEAPVEGVFEYRSVQRRGNGDTDFPKFITYTNNARIKNIGENIQYVGGFSLIGSKVSTGALDGSPSNITVSLDGKPKFKASAANYSLSDSLIISNRAVVLIYQGKDSLMHPGIRLKYSKPTKNLSLTRFDESQTSPFYASYHQMEINAGMLNWNLATPLVDFSILSAKNQVPAQLMSMEYFTENSYEHLKGTADFHPLIVMANFADKQRSNSFFLADLAQKTKIKEDELRVAASMLARQNFLYYNNRTGEVTLKAKAFHYLRSAQKKKDYDYITLKSMMPSGKNATLDLNKNELIVRGVERFYLTGDSMAVYAVPDSNQVRVLRNRDIKFNGQVLASHLKFKGSKFTFKYKDFLIDMAKIDTIAFAVKKKDKKGLKGNDPGEQFISNTINKTSGILYLNKPDNKSGKKKHLNYPMFNATSGAYVFFNKPEILGGAYDTTVYFEIPPFKIDSLGNTVPRAIGLKGKFHSGGIFPPLETKLEVMPDQSLGFIYKTPKGGLPAYGGKGKYYNTITLNYKGLQGNGDIEYLSAKLQSNAFTFYLDKVHTLGTRALVTEAQIGNAYYMEADFDKYALEWFPQKDTMNISTVSEPIKLYNGKFIYRGMATLTRTGFYGDGLVEGTDGTIKSPLLQFAKTNFKANKAILEIKSNIPEKPVLRATDVFVDYDLKSGITAFAPEKAGTVSTEFPYSQFKTSLNSGKWDVTKKLVVMKEPDDKSEAKAYFVSTRPSHENLKFKAKSSTYDISKNTLLIGGIPYIAAADAHIVPENNQIYIEKAELRPLQNAAVITDTIQKHHQMFKGEVDIVSRYKYQGYARANYVNAQSDTFAIKFEKFIMRNMDKAKALASVKTKVFIDTTKAPKVASINTEILPDDPMVNDPVEESEQKGVFRKVGFLNKKKKEETDGMLAIEALTAPPGEGKEPAPEELVNPKKAKAFGFLGKKEGISNVIDSTGTDSTATSFKTLVAKIGKRKSKGDLDEDDMVPYTVALASIKEDDNLFIAPGVRYKGNVTMNSNKQYWDFDGFVKLAFSDAQGASDWFPYQATVNPAEVKINIEKPTAADATPLKTGLHVSAANNKIYNTFVSKKKDEADLDVFEVEGQLAYLKKKKEFRIGKPARVSGEELEGNLLVYNDSSNVSRYEGKFKLMHPTKIFAINAAGTTVAKSSEKQYKMDALLALDIKLPEQAVVSMGNTLSETTSGAPEAKVDMASVVNKLAQFVGTKEARSFAEKSTYTPLASFSSKFVKSLVLSGVQLQWSDSTKAWYSVGNLNLSNVLKRDINAQVPGYIEIKRGSASDIVSVYLEPLPAVWYYFSFDNNVVLAASSEQQFFNQIAKKKGRTLIPGEEMDKVQFVNYFRRNYLKNSKTDAPAVKVAPAKEPGFDFAEETDAKKKKKKAKTEEKVQTPAPAARESALPEITEEPKEPKKKKKSKRGGDDGLLPDVDMN